MENFEKILDELVQSRDRLYIAYIECLVKLIQADAPQEAFEMLDNEHVANMERLTKTIKKAELIIANQA